MSSRSSGGRRRSGGRQQQALAVVVALRRARARALEVFSAWVEEGDDKSLCDRLRDVRRLSPPVVSGSILAMTLLCALTCFGLARPP
jgi:hypothetical protein